MENGAPPAGGASGVLLRKTGILPSRFRRRRSVQSKLSHCKTNRKVTGGGLQRSRLRKAAKARLSPIASAVVGQLRVSESLEQRCMLSVTTQSNGYISVTPAAGDPVVY